VGQAGTATAGRQTSQQRAQQGVGAAAAAGPGGQQEHAAAVAARRERLWEAVADLAVWRPDVAFHNAIVEPSQVRPAKLWTFGTAWQATSSRCGCRPCLCHPPLQQALGQGAFPLPSFPIKL
jgi:hypothetical protein